MPRNSSTWLPESATEWKASAIIAALDVRNPTTNFDTAISELPMRAAITADLDPSAAMEAV